MSQKTDAKRQLIIDKATEIFASKGYREVTMKDIVENCEISRGGLYLYYSSTEEIFLDVLSEDQDGDNIDDLEGASAAELLLWFLKEQKREILKKKNNLIVAKYEYAFACRQNGKNSGVKKKIDTEALILEKILIKGNESGEFVCKDPKATAGNMVYAIQGMKVCQGTAGISEKKVDSELVYMMRQFMEVED